MRPFTLTEVMDWACVTLTHCSRFSRSSFSSVEEGRQCYRFYLDFIRTILSNYFRTRKVWVCALGNGYSYIVWNGSVDKSASRPGPGLYTTVQSR